MKLILKCSEKKIAVITFLFQFSSVKFKCELTRPKCEVKLCFYDNATGGITLP